MALAPAFLGPLLSLSGPLLWTCLTVTCLLAIPALLGLKKTLSAGH